MYLTEEIQGILERLHGEQLQVHHLVSKISNSGFRFERLVLQK